MAKRILKSGRLTPRIVCIWGYHPELLLMSQDEDLLLHRVEFIPVLLELAGDELCPKRDYAFSILCAFCRESVTRGGERGTALICSAWAAIPEPAGGRPAEWHRYVGRILSYTKPSGPVDKPAARQMAEDLLLGIGRVGRLVEGSPPRPGWWRFTLQTSVTEHIDVCEATGAFAYVPYYSLPGS